MSDTNNVNEAPAIPVEPVAPVSPVVPVEPAIEPGLVVEESTSTASTNEPWPASGITQTLETPESPAPVEPTVVVPEVVSSVPADAIQLSQAPQVESQIEPAPTLPHLMRSPDSQAAKLNELLAALGGNNTSCGYSATANGDLLGTNIRSTFPTQDALDAANVLIAAFEQAHSLVIDKALELET